MISSKMKPYHHQATPVSIFFKLLRNKVTSITAESHACMYKVVNRQKFYETFHHRVTLPPLNIKLLLSNNILNL